MFLFFETKKGTNNLSSNPFQALFSNHQGSEEVVHRGPEGWQIFSLHSEDEPTPIHFGLHQLLPCLAVELLVVNQQGGKNGLCLAWALVIEDETGSDLLLFLHALTSW